MDNKKRRKRRKNRTRMMLIRLICLLSIVLLIGLGVIACQHIGQEENPDQTQDTPGNSQSDATDHTTGTTQSPETTEPTVLLTGWQELDGKTYYYDDTGLPFTGATEIEGVLYCFGDDGALAQAGFCEIGGSTYYVNQDGTAYFGWLELEDALYYLREDGTMARGQEEIDGQTWFFTSTGCQIYVVNPWYSVPEGYDVELVKLDDHYGNNRYVADFMYEPLMQMITDCEAAMVELYGNNAPTLFVRSAYRTNYDQTCLFENKVQRVKDANPGYTQEQAEAEAATVVAIPGTSEHQLGLAVDIIDTQLWELSEAQEDLAGQQWLMEHCWEYGFILRYPKGTTDVTGIIYEPWHYRYVGLELAAELHELGITLEEYIDSLD